MNNPLITVIVPVYKVERYLPRCIESILRQTYTNFELILVDDGTPDRSGIICDRYAEKDSRIRVIHKENGGVSTARNAGIDAAKGEWITFIDSDDWVLENYLMVLTEKIGDYEYDLVVGAKENRGINVMPQGTPPKTINTMQNNDINDLKVFDGVEYMGPWMKLFSVKILRENDIRFIQGIAMGEDAIFVAEYLRWCKKIYMSGEVIYRYNTLNYSSISRKAPYFEDRKLWDLRYLREYSNMMDAFKVADEIKRVVMFKKAVLGFTTVTIAIVNNFNKTDSVRKITELFEYYSEWLAPHKMRTDVFEKEEQRLLAQFIIENDAFAIYELLQPRNKNTIKGKLKQKVKEMLCPLIEKHRDGLIKFKF